jgi:4-amino-4-deoxy-L-arabinose transferase-like glycosyltransferase
VITRDGIAYLETARQFAAGDPMAFQRHTAPGFPLVVSVFGRGFGVGEPQALVVAALCGALAIVGVALLAFRLGGRRAAILAAVLTAFLPLLVELGGEVLSEPLLLATIPWTLWALARLAGPRSAWAGAGWGALAGVLGGLGYLARPEGILVLVAGGGLLLIGRRGVPWRRRLADLAWLSWPALLVVVAFMVAIRSESVLGGSQGGAWKLTLKRNLGYHLGQWTLGMGAANLSEQLRRLGQALWPALGLAPALVWLWRRPAAGEAAEAEEEVQTARALVRRLLWGSGAALLTAYVAIRPDRRYAAPLALLAIPLLASAGARWLEGTESGARSRRWAVVLVPLLAASLGLGLEPRRAAKAGYREAGRVLAEHGASRVLAHDSRAAFYARAQALELIWLVPQEPRSPEAIVEAAQRERADSLVLVEEDAEDRARVAAVSRLLGTPGQRVEVSGAVPLRVFWLGQP